MCKAIVFDFDGVFIDTELLKTLSYYRTLVCRDGPYAEKVDVDEERYLVEHPVGQGRQDVCEWILDRFDIGDEARRRAEQIERMQRENGKSFDSSLYRSIRDGYEPKGEWNAWKAVAFDRGLRYESMKDDAPAIPAAVKFLKAVKKTGLLVGLVTRTGRQVTLKHLERVGLDVDAFDAMVCEGDDEVVGLDKQEFYGTACAGVGVAPEDCVAIEDTDTGVASARKAGVGFIVAVPTPLTRKQDFIAQGACAVVEDLTLLLPVMRRSRLT